MTSRNELKAIIVATDSEMRFKALEAAYPSYLVRRVTSQFDEERYKKDIYRSSLYPGPEILQGDPIDYSQWLATKKVEAAYNSIRRKGQLINTLPGGYGEYESFYIVSGDSVQAIIPENQDHTWEGQTKILEKPPSLIEYISKEYYKLQSNNKVSIVTSLAGIVVDRELVESQRQPELFNVSVISEFYTLPFTRDDFIQWLKSDPHHNLNGFKNSAGGIPLLKAKFFDPEKELEVYMQIAKQPPQIIFKLDKLKDANDTILMQCVYGTFPKVMDISFKR